MKEPTGSYHWRAVTILGMVGLLNIPNNRLFIAAGCIALALAQLLLALGTTRVPHPLGQMAVWLLTAVSGVLLIVGVLRLAG